MYRILNKINDNLNPYIVEKLLRNIIAPYKYFKHLHNVKCLNDAHKINACFLLITRLNG